MGAAVGKDIQGKTSFARCFHARRVTSARMERVKVSVSPSASARRGGRAYDTGIPPLGLPFGLTPPYRTPSIEAPEYMWHPTTPRGPISSPPGGISWSVRFSVPGRGQAHILGELRILADYGDSLRGRPRTRRVDSSPSCFAVCSVQYALPYGLPRRTDRRIAWSSASI